MLAWMQREPADDATSFGDRRETIFEDDVDRQTFPGVLAEVVEHFNCPRHAYRPMGNH